jgi:DNA-binding beta-propeller fold protein YncE
VPLPTFPTQRFPLVSKAVPGTNTPIAADTITASLSQPFGLAFDASGNAWVGNYHTSTVTAYAPGINAAIPSYTITPAASVNGPAALAFTP